MARTMKRGLLEQMAEELLALRPKVERYEKLQRDLKQSMHDLGVKEVVIADQGRVYISVSERTTVDPDLARAALGDDLAAKVFKTKIAVCNTLLAALAEMGDISDVQMGQILDYAEKRDVINLHIRPLG